MLIDEAEITIKAGHGGAGKVSFYGKVRGGPDGGDGGKGGDIYVQSTVDLYALKKYISLKILEAENGLPGGSNKKSGSNGKDLILLMPVGTFLIDQKTNEEIELSKPDQKELLVRGGLGGKGNVFFKSSSNTTPKYAQPGLYDDEK